MNYLSEINAFENWCEINPLSTTAQLLWYKLIALNNRAGWIEWFSATNPYLMVKLGISDEKTLILNRNKLKLAGLIDFKSGKKGQPSKYKICFFTGKNPVNAPVQTPVNTPVNIPVQTPDIIDKDIDKKEIKKKVKKNNPDSDKKSFGEFVNLTHEEHLKLIERFGEMDTKYLIELLDNYKGASGKKYKSDYRAILTWPIKELEKSKKEHYGNTPARDTNIPNKIEPVLEEGL